jgi:hypothetical protein
MEQLLEKLTLPVAAPATAGSNCTSSVEACPGVSVIGNFAPGSENPFPVTLPALTVTVPVPDDVIVTDWVASVFRATLPKATVVALIVSVGAVAFSVSAKVFEIPPAVAVSVAV